MRRVQVFVVMMMFVQIGFAQINSKSIELEEVRKVNIFYPGYEVEKPLSGKMSWGYMIGTHIWFQASQHLKSDQSYGLGFDYIDIVPTAELYGRWYYNINKRTGKKKKTGNNSASYLTVGAAVMIDGIRIAGDDYSGDDNFYSGIYAGWGMRRTIGRKFTLDLHFKLQPTFQGKSYYGLAILSGLRFAYLLSNN